eukprot:365171-Chlamydomonas_euryale.AAC.8
MYGDTWKAILNPSLFWQCHSSTAHQQKEELESPSSPLKGGTGGPWGRMLRPRMLKTRQACSRPDMFPPRLSQALGRDLMLPPLAQ